MPVSVADIAEQVESMIEGRASLFFFLFLFVWEEEREREGGEGMEISLILLHLQVLKEA